MPDRVKISIDDVKHVARLSRLALSDDRLQKLSGQLASILQYVDQLQSVNVDGIEPMAHALPISNVLRDDVVEPSLPLAQVLQNAPDAESPFFKVPKVIGAEEDSAG